LREVSCEQVSMLSTLDKIVREDNESSKPSSLGGLKETLMCVKKPGRILMIRHQASQSSWIKQSL